MESISAATATSTATSTTATLQLVPRALPVVASEERFCPPTNSKLILTHTKQKKGFGKFGEVKVTDGATGNLKFSCFPAKNKWKSIFHEKIIKEEERIGEEFILRQKLVSFSNQFFLISPKNEEKKLTYFTNFVTPNSNKIKISAEFKDVLQKGKGRLVLLKGRVDNGEAVIYLGDPKKEGERIVGKIVKGRSSSRGDNASQNKRRESTWSTSSKVSLDENEEYLLEAAGGIDLLVIMGLCLLFMEGNYQFKLNKGMVVVPLK